MKDLVVDPSIVANLCCGIKHNIILSWKAAPVGFLKLNVDGAMLKNDLIGGIGGILRNSERKQLDIFFEPIRQGPPILDELLALKYGLEAFSNLNSGLNMQLIVECDNKVAVEWILNPMKFPSSFVSLVRIIAELIRTKNVLLRHILRVCNVDADVLAKKGIG
ncbi:hypothetical protein GQ457_08G025380 [Hibiscus cannabinus]